MKCSHRESDNSRNCRLQRSIGMGRMGAAQLRRNVLASAMMSEPTANKIRERSLALKFVHLASTIVSLRCHRESNNPKSPNENVPAAKNHIKRELEFWKHMQS